MLETCEVQSGKPSTKEELNLIPNQCFSCVELHILCENCQFFAQETVSTQWIQQPSVSKAPQYLCDVAQLRRNQGNCHLCILVLSKLEQSKLSIHPSYVHWKVYLQAIKRDGKVDQIRISLASANTLEDSISPLPALLDVRTYSHSARGGFDQHITSPKVPLKARDNLERAREWIQTCKKEHTECNAFHSKTTRDGDERPTRVLEVSSTSVRLRCNMSKETFEYLVLSHMWGNEPTRQLRLGLDSLEQFQMDIPIQLLSDVYKEAIRATIGMGYKYLWIDSLCIIQDSESDWEYEARRMALVYGNAACNLAHLFPPSHPSPGQRGIIVQDKSRMRDDPRAWNPCVIRPAQPESPGIYIAHPTSNSRPATQLDDERLPWLMQRRWPLFARAWTFQEYLLAPRTLLLGHANLMWQCSHFFYDELLGPLGGSSESGQQSLMTQFQGIGKRRYYPTSLFDLASIENPFAAAGWQFMWHWIKSANEYRKRNLTKPKDRIMAFAGIAHATAHMGGVTYVAGLWYQILPVCLLWTVKERSAQDICKDGPERYPVDVQYTCDIREEVVGHVPSWSWFSVPIYKHYDLGVLLEERNIYLKSESEKGKSQSEIYFDDLWWISKYAWHIDGRTECSPKHESYDDFKNLKLTLEAPILPVRLFKPGKIQERIDEIRTTHPLDADIDWTPDFIYYPDDPNKIGKAAPRGALLVHLAAFQVTLGKKAVTNQSYVGLVVKQAEQEGVWKRLGVFKLKIAIDGACEDDTSPRGVADRWRDYGNLLDYWQMAKIDLA